MTIKKSKMIEKIVECGNLWKSAYGYILNESGAIEKVYHGSSKREVYATAEEVEMIRKANESKCY